MRKRFSVLLTLFINLISLQRSLHSQSDTWSIHDKENVVNECLEYDWEFLNHLSEKEKTARTERLCVCVINEITYNYNKNFFYNKTDIEKKRIIIKEARTCAEDLGLLTSSTENKYSHATDQLNRNNVPEQTPAVKVSPVYLGGNSKLKESNNSENSGINEKTNFESLDLKTKLLGRWRDENSDFWFFSNGNFVIFFDNGSLEQGKYSVSGNNKFYTNTEYEIYSFQNPKSFIYFKKSGNKKEYWTANKKNEKSLDSLEKNFFAGEWLIDKGKFRNVRVFIKEDGTYKTNEGCKGKWYFDKNNLELILDGSPSLCTIEKFKIFSYNENVFFGFVKNSASSFKRILKNE